MEEVAGKTRRISFSDLKAFSRDILKKAGLGDGDAELVADTLVVADLRGTHSHGVIRLPFYTRRLLEGGVNPRPALRVIREDISCAVVDGDNGLGQVVAARSMRIAIEKAKGSGVGCVVARNSDHFGAAAYYAMMALKEDMIGVVWTNGSTVMAPWGGRQKGICNNPLAIAVPTGKRDPVVLDMAMSVVAGGKVRLAAKKGERIPSGWVVDKHGRNTEDPNDLPDGGLCYLLGTRGMGWRSWVKFSRGCSQGVGSFMRFLSGLLILHFPRGTGIFIWR